MKATKDTISSLFYWSSIADDIKTFCNTCLHCVSTIGGERMPRPLGEAIHADKPNEVLHFDYLYMGPSNKEDQYLLILKDDLSGYVWLTASPSADSETTADALVRWFSSFGVVRT
jgi:Integrase zinc binding domain